jgi:hypothetical protein
MTAHSSQGKTLRAVLLDLSVDKRVDTTFGAVAASRVASRHDCLILRPFEHWLFERGVSEGPQLLLQQLRGEQVDWMAYKEGLAPWSTCRRCWQVKTLDGYEHEQWEHVRANKPAMCMQCKHGDTGPKTRKLEKDAKRIACSMCKINKIEDAFPAPSSSRATTRNVCPAAKPSSACGAADAKRPRASNILSLPW